MIKHQIDSNSIDTLILIKNDKYFLRSDAVFEIIKDISGYWYLFGVFKVLPLFIRDYCYTLVSNNRYNIFGKKDSCMMPSDNVKNRFI